MKTLYDCTKFIKFILIIIKNLSVHFPNLFGKGERLSTEYSQGTNNHIDYRLNYNSPIGMDPNNQYLLQ